jgi:hypothetical protein
MQVNPGFSEFKDRGDRSQGPAPTCVGGPRRTAKADRACLPRSAVAAFLILCSAVVGAQSTIDLNDPEALDSLFETNPEHYRTVVDVLCQAEGFPARRRAGVLPAALKVKNYRLMGGLMVSYPPKRRLSFQLDDVTYVKTILVGAEGR